MSDVNNIGFCYGSVANVEAYAAPSMVFVTGRTNRNDPAFQRARKKGAEVWEYYDPIEVPTSTSGLDLDFYLGNVSAVPLWGNGRINYANHLMTDMRAGSSWSDHVVDYITARMQSGQVDGVFLDCVGSRLWSSLAKWDTWAQAEREAWALGNVDLVRRLHTQRMKLNDDFGIVNNNLWHLATEGERYVNGVCLELPTVGLSAFHRAYAEKPFGVPWKRRVFVIARPPEGRAWSKVPGVTHVCETTVYKAPTPPIVPHVDLRIPELRAKVERLKQQLAAAHAGGDDSAVHAELIEVRAALAEAVETRAMLGARVDMLTDKVQRMAAFNAKEAEGVE